jgi:hypothetical protein
MKSTIKLALAFAVLLALAPLAPSVAVPPSASTAATSVTSIPNATWSVGADGWTVFNGSPGTGTCGNSSSNYTGTCVVYVTNAGNDATCSAQPLPVTSTPAHPCATPAKAQTLLRNGSPDWMLLKKGDKWSGGMNGPTSGAWNRIGGRSAAEPMLISSYGTGARPLFTTNGVDTACYMTTANRGQFMAIVGIQCYVDYADPASPTYLGVTAVGDISSNSPTITGMASTKGIAVGYIAFGSGINGLTVQSVTANSVTLSGNPSFTSVGRSIQFNKPFNTGSSFGLVGVTNFFIMEDCMLRFGGLGIINVNPGVPISGFYIRIARNELLDAYGSIGHGGNGVFLSDNQAPGGSILLQENIIDHAGYNTSIWGAGGNVFSQNVYLHEGNPPVSFIGNITSNAAATGAQVRNGGTIYNNLSIGNPIAFTSNPGIQFNPTIYSYNVITEGSDIIVGIRNAIGATASGTKVLNLDGVLTTGNYNFIGLGVSDLDNPGAVTGSVASVTATTATMTANVAAGKRGNGVQVGDRLALYSSRGWGVVLGPTGTFAVEPNTGGGTYPVGSSVFYFNGSAPLPSWVVPGMNVGVFLQSAFQGGQTKIASISADRSSIKTVNASSQVIVGGTVSTGGEQGAFVFWTAGDYSHFPQQTFGPNNIFTTSAVLGGTSFAYSPQSFTQNINGSGNYYYNWNTVTAQNLQDLGISGANINVPNKLNVAGSTSYPKATIEAYDASIGGPGTAAHFIAQARMQSKDTYNILYTANAANNFIRNAIGCNCSQ